MKHKNVGHCSAWLITLRCAHPDATADQMTLILITKLSPI